MATPGLTWLKDGGPVGGRGGTQQARGDGHSGHGLAQYRSMSIKKIEPPCHHGGV